jgi:DNA polymerase
VTNAVKHFRFVQRGKRRIHAKPGREHIEACLPWLDKELAVVSPEIVVALGATAVQALMGSKYRVMRDRGALLPWRDGIQAVVTIHPSAVLRMPPEDRTKAFGGLVADLKVAAGALTPAS